MTAKPTRAAQLLGVIQAFESQYTPPMTFKDIQDGLDRIQAAMGKINADEIPPQHHMAFGKHMAELQEHMGKAAQVVENMSEYWASNSELENSAAMGAAI